MRTHLFLAATLIVIVIVFATSSAKAAPSYSLIWSATTGAGTPGGSTIDAAVGDVLTLDVIINIDATGLRAAEWDLRGTTALLAMSSDLISIPGTGGPPECPAPPNFNPGLCTGLSFTFRPASVGIYDFVSNSQDYDVMSFLSEFTLGTMTIGRGLFRVLSGATVETVELGFGGASGGGRVTDGFSVLSLSNAFADIMVVVPPVSINIDMGSVHGTPSSSFGTASGLDGTWNQAVLGNTMLLDTSGAMTNADVFVDANGIGSAGPAASNDGQVLLYDHVSITTSEDWNVDISGLPPASYDVFLYAPSRFSVVTGDLTVNGMSLPSLPGDSAGDLIPMVSFGFVTTFATGGVIEISGSNAPIGLFKGLAGIQLVPAPEPSRSLALAIGGIALSFLAKRRRPVVR